MGIAHANSGTASSGGTNTITPAYPATPASGDLFVNLVICKYANRTINTVAGWTALGTTTGGAGTDGTTDEGQIKIAAFTAVSAGTESGTISQTLTGGTANMAAARIARFTRSAGTGWLFGANAVASQNTGGSTSLSFTFDADPGIQSGDAVVVCAALNADTYSVASHALSAAGCTFDGGTELMDSGFADGSDARMLMVIFQCTAGTSTGVATYTGTASGSATNAPAGAATLLRLREDGVGGGSAPTVAQYRAAIADLWKRPLRLLSHRQLAQWAAATPFTGALVGPTAGTVGQIARPIADLAAGGWTTQSGGTTNLYAVLDEDTPDDADYVRSAVNATNDVLRVSLTSLQQPLAGPGTLKIRHKRA